MTKKENLQQIDKVKMPLEITKGSRFISLALDEVAYRIVSYLNRRAMRRENTSLPLISSTTDLITHRLISTGIFESTQIEALDAILENNFYPLKNQSNKLDLFVDVGANIGIYTTRYSPLFNKVVSIEASPITCQVLKANIYLTNSKNVVPVCVGASDKKGILPLKLRIDGNLGWSTLEEGEGGDTYSVDVPLKPVDKIVEEHASTSVVSLIKIDVEGHEKNVLIGAQEILKKHRPVVLYENIHGEDARNCNDILCSNGYNNFVIFTRKANPIKILQKVPIYAETVNPRNLGHASLICAF